MQQLIQNDMIRWLRANGNEPFLTYEGLPSDHYLWLTGEGARLLRGELEASEAIPNRETLTAD